MRGFRGDGGPATNASLWFPEDVAAAKDGTFYIADSGNSRIRRVTPDGVISTVAGTGSCGFSGDGGPAVEAQICRSRYIALSPAGELYISDLSRIRKVDLAGTITTIAGNDTFGFSGDGGLATEASLEPSDVAVDGDGNVYMSTINRVRRVTTDGIIQTIAGTGRPGASGDGGPAVAARLQGPLGIDVDQEGNIYVADTGNHLIRKISVGEPEFAVTQDGVLNAASNVQAPDPLHPPAPGSIASIFGHFAWGSANATSVPLPTELAGITVAFNGIPAPLFAVIRGSDLGLTFDQINAQIPWGVETASGVATVVVTHDGQSTSPVEIQVAPVSPGIFTFEFGSGPAIVQNFQLAMDDVIDGSFAQAEGSIPGQVTQPAPIGGVVILYANGLGAVNEPIEDGAAGLRQPQAEIRVLIGGVEAQILGVVLHPTLVALNQLNVFVPAVEPGDQVSIQVEADGILSRPDVYIAVREAP